MTSVWLRIRPAGRGEIHNASPYWRLIELLFLINPKGNPGDAGQRPMAPPPPKKRLCRASSFLGEWGGFSGPPPSFPQLSAPGARFPTGTRLPRLSASPPPGHPQIQGLAGGNTPPEKVKPPSPTHTPQHCENRGSRGGGRQPRQTQVFLRQTSLAPPPEGEGRRGRPAPPFSPDQWQHPWGGGATEGLAPLGRSS